MERKIVIYLDVLSFEHLNKVLKRVRLKTFMSKAGKVLEIFCIQGSVVNWLDEKERTEISRIEGLVRNVCM